MIEWLTSPQTWIALVTLTALEIVLGIDNIIFISILAGKLPKPQQPRARRLGLLLAMFMRIVLLLSLAWIIRLTAPLFSRARPRDLRPRPDPDRRRPVPDRQGDLEIHDKLEGEEGHESAQVAPSFAAVIVQIMLLDIVFSLDSVITAVGMAERSGGDGHRRRVLAVGVMMVSAERDRAFVERHPTVKMLALSFLLLIGVSLVADGLRPAHPEGLHLLRDGLLGVRRDDQPAGPHQGKAGRAAPSVHVIVAMP